MFKLAPSEFAAKYEPVIDAQRKFSGNLLTLEFVTIDQYLALLEYCAPHRTTKHRLACSQIFPQKRNAMVYLAAAVSDFYIPPEEQVAHKIQSTESEGLHLDLKPVPKVLYEYAL